MEFQLLHTTNIIPPLYPIVLLPFILLGYPTYRNNSRTYFCPRSTPWNIILFPEVKCPHRVLLALRCTNSSIDHISHILENGQNLHGVTTHKIHISTNDANFIDSQIVTISCISSTCLNSTLQYKRIVPTITTILLLRHNYLAQVFFSLRQSLAKCPASLQRKHITSERS